MRIALCNEVVRELDFTEQCRFAASLGYDGLEIAPFTLGDEPHRLSAAIIARMRQSAEDSGIAIAGLHWLLLAPAGLSITHEDAAIRGHTTEVIRGLIALCAGLGGRYVVHGSPAQRMLASGRIEDDRAHAIAFFQEAARMAEAAGVVYCLEPLSPDQTNFVNSVAEGVEIVEAIGSPALRTMVDCSAAGASETQDIPSLLRQWLPGGKIAHIHFNDPSRRGPGEGDLAFAPIVRTLSALGYDGWIGVEPFVYEPDGRSCAARAIGYVRGLMEAVQ